MMFLRILQLAYVAIVDIILQRLFFPSTLPLDDDAASGDWLTPEPPRTPRDRLVIITGANSGIGLEATRLLAHRSLSPARSTPNRGRLHLVIACRTTSKGEEAVKAIREGLAAHGLTSSDGAAAARPRFSVEALDLASLESVRAFARRVARASDGVVDGLVLNAGVMALPRRRTEDGVPEMHVGVNHVGHFLLTMLLLPALRRSDAPKIVCVSSAASVVGQVRLDDIDYAKRGFHPMLAYCDSKLFNLMFTKELARRLSRSAPASPITINAVHPGEVTTDISRNLPRWMYLIHQIAGSMLLIPPSTAAWTLVYPLLSPKLKNTTGQFFWHVTRPPLWTVRAAEDERLREELWDATVELAKMTPDEIEFAGRDLFPSKPI